MVNRNNLQTSVRFLHHEVSETRLGTYQTIDHTFGYVCAVEECRDVEASQASDGFSSSFHIVLRGMVAANFIWIVLSVI